MPFQPTDEISIRLSVTEWNQIIAALQEEKQRIANPLINKINQQAAQQDTAAAAAAFANPAPMQPAGFVNGETTDIEAEASASAMVPKGDIN